MKKLSRIAAAIMLSAMVIPAADAFAATSASTAASTASAASSSASTADKSKKPAQSMTVKYAKVVSVSKSTVNANLGEIKLDENMKGKGFPGGKMPADADGKTPPTADGQTPPAFDGKTPPAFDGKAPTDADGKRFEKPSGDADGKDAKPDISSMITWDEKQTAINVSSVKITKDGKDASVSDISKDDILTLIYKDGKLSEIHIGAEMHMGGPRGKGRGDRQKSADARTKSDKTTKNAAAQTTT